MSNCVNCVNEGKLCDKCVRNEEFQDYYQVRTYRHLCSICGYWWEDTKVDDPERCPQCCNEWE